MYGRIPGYIEEARFVQYLETALLNLTDSICKGSTISAMYFEKIKFLITQSFSEWSEDNASRLAAALAYYTIFSIPPLLIIVIAIAAQIFDRTAVQQQIINQIAGLVGSTGAEAIEVILDNASESDEGSVAAILSVVTLILGASGVFGQLHGALNTIWEVKPKPGRGILGTIKDRFFSFTMVLGVGFLLMVSLMVSTVLAAFNEFVTNALPSLLILAQLINFVVSFGIITILFALIFKVVPDVRVAWRDVWVGALVTAFLFTVGKWAIGLYLGNSAPGSTYGAAGSLIVLLLWVYYSAQILFLGAEFTQVYANKYGSRIVADENAIGLTPLARGELRAEPSAAQVTIDDERKDRLQTVGERRSILRQTNPVIPANREPSPAWQKAEAWVQQFHAYTVLVLAFLAASWRVFTDFWNSRTQ